MDRYDVQQRHILDQIANAQAQALDDLIGRLRGEPFPVPYTPTYARHGCGICGDTERLEDNPCPRCQP